MTSDVEHQIPSWRVGHWTHPAGTTGCTVLIPDRPALAVADVRGGAPGTRETDLLATGSLVQRLDAILLTGGSAFGLRAADGVVRWLRERGRGFPTSSIPVPIVAAAVLYDLAGPDPDIPDQESGYLAASTASTRWPAGRAGAGAGATVGKAAGRQYASPAGLGAARVQSGAGSVTAICAVNAYGDVIDPRDGTILAGTRGTQGPADWRNTRDWILRSGDAAEGSGQNTSIGAVIVDAPLDRDGLTRVAIAAHDGLARAIRPAHTIYDGDTIFAASVHAVHAAHAATAAATVLRLATAAELAMEQAVVNSVRQVTGSSAEAS